MTSVSLYLQAYNVIDVDISVEQTLTNGRAQDYNIVDIIYLTLVFG